MNNLLICLFQAAKMSAEELKKEIHSIKYLPFSSEDTYDKITFIFRNQKYTGSLKGRNRDLLLGFGEENDKAIVIRVILDNDCILS